MSLRVGHWRWQLPASLLVIPLVANLVLLRAEPRRFASKASIGRRASSDSLFPPAVIRDDFEFLYATLKTAHYDLFARISEERYDREYARVLAAIDRPMRRLDIIRLFAPFVALGDIAHAHLDFPFPDFALYGRAGGTVLPLDLRIQSGRGFITYSAATDPRLEAGTEVRSLDGRPIAEWGERLGRYLAADTPYLKSALMESFGVPRLLWLDRGQVDSFTVDVRTAAGQSAVVTVPAVPAGSFFDAPRPGRAAGSTREVRNLEDGVAYLRPGPFYDTYAAVTKGEFDPRIFRSFVDSAFRQILSSGSTDLIIDLRGNPGGDNSFSDLMVAWFATTPFRFCSSYSLKASATTRSYYRAVASRQLPKGDADAVAQLNAALASRLDGERFPFDIPLVDPRPGERYTGRVYALVDRFSYSMATSVAAQIQDYHFGSIVGEATADLPTSYGSVAQFTLPKTGIVVNYPKGYLIRPSGDTRASGVVPDVPIEFPVNQASGDPGLSAAVRAIVDRRPR